MITYYAIGRSEHRHWRNASAGHPTKYYRITEDGTYEPAAYVFPVESDADESIGYITVSATRSWSPVLAYSNAEPPSTNLETAKEEARSMGFEPTGPLLYQGGNGYGIQVSDHQMVHLGSRQLAPVRHTSELLAHDSAEIETVDTRWMWDTYTSSTFDPESMVTTASSSKHLNFDPYAWDGHYGEGYPNGDGSGGDPYPDNRGMPDDSWDAWDGCSPIAGTQIIMYHEGWANTSTHVEKREKICDALHHLMDTNNAGWTDTYDIDNGFNQIADELDFLNNTYDGENEYNLSKSLVRSQIDAEQPCVFTNYNTYLDSEQSAETSDVGTRSKDKTDNYDGHSVVMSGYEDGDSLEIDTYTGWHTNRETITYGSWDSTAMITKVKL